MVEITTKDIKNFEKSLPNALVKHSKGRLSKQLYDKVAIETIKNIDIENSALNHKGIN